MGTRRGAALAVIAAMGLLATIAWYAVPQGDARDDVSASWISLPVEPGEPCAGAEESRATAADLAVADAVADSLRDDLDAVWRCGGDRVLDFGPLTLSFERGWSEVDPADKLADLQADYGGEIRDVAGAPAWINPADDESQSLELLLVRDGTLLRFSTASDSGVTSEDLVAAATSLPR